MSLSRLPLVPRLGDHLRRIAKGYRHRHDLYGKPCPLALYPWWYVRDRLAYGRIGPYVAFSRRVTGWTRGPEAVALAQTSYGLPDGAVIVEIGSFLGRGAILLGGARRARGSGRLYCVDPFDASGEAFSVPIYRAIIGRRRRTMREEFERNIRGAGLSGYVTVCQGRAEDVARTWHEAVDMLVLDGDQSYEGVRRSYESWVPFLKQGGVIALHNSSDRAYAEGHDGHRRLVLERIRPPVYGEIHCVGTTTFARRVTYEQQ